MSKLPQVREDGMQRVECCKCGHLLLYSHPSALRAGKAQEIKCGKCDTLNYLVGYEAA